MVIQVITVLVEWNDMNKSQSWVNFFALSHSNPTLIISFSRVKITIWIRCPSAVSYNNASLNHQQLLKRYKRFQPTQKILSTNSESKYPKELKIQLI
jgi:hypothetical protein